MNQVGIFVHYWENSWELDHKKYVDRAAKLGFDILEFETGTLVNCSKEERKEIVKRAEDNGIKLTYCMGLNAKYDISSEDSSIRRAGIDHLKEVLGVIAEMGGDTYSGVNYAGWGAPRYVINDKSEMLDRSVECMKEIIKVAEDKGITYCVECVNRFESALINTAQEGLDYIERVDSKSMGIHLDTFHMNIEESSMGGAIKLAGDNLKHLHIGDNNRRAPGRGHIDWKEIGDALREIQYSHAIVTEPFIKMGGEVARDVFLWRDLTDGMNEEQLDQEAKNIIEFAKSNLM